MSISDETPMPTTFQAAAIMVVNETALSLDKYATHLYSTKEHLKALDPSDRDAWGYEVQRLIESMTAVIPAILTSLNFLNHVHGMLDPDSLS